MIACRRYSAALSENKFHEVAGKDLETLQDQLDTILESGVTDGDVSLEVRRANNNHTEMKAQYETMHARHVGCATPQLQLSYVSCAGWSADCNSWPVRNVCAEQASSKSADLVIFSSKWACKI